MWLCFSMALVFLNTATTEMDASLKAWNAGLWFESRPSQGCCSDEHRGTPSGLEMLFIHTHWLVRPNVSVCLCVRDKMFTRSHSWYGRLLYVRLIVFDGRGKQMVPLSILYTHAPPKAPTSPTLGL